MAQINDLLVLGESNLLGTLNVFGDVTAPNFHGKATSAINDTNGDQIDTTYVKRSGSVMTGNLYIKGANPSVGFQDASGITQGYVQYLASSGNFGLGTSMATGLQVTANGSLIIPANQTFTPATTNTGSIGTSTVKWNAMYATTFYGALSGNATTSSYPLGFVSRSDNATWGSQTGTTVTCWNEVNGGSVDWRRDNPSSGKISLKVDGRVYVNEGNTPLLGAAHDGSYWGITDPDGNANVYIRTPQQGLIPYQGGKIGSGHQYLGTDTWRFSQAYIDYIHGHKIYAGKAASQSEMTASGIHVHDIRDLAVTPDTFGGQSVNFYFKTELSRWRGIFHMKGWADEKTYAAWQLAGNAHTTIENKLYYREGVGAAASSWGDWLSVAFENRANTFTKANAFNAATTFNALVTMTAALNMSNTGIYGVDNLKFNDPGHGEGITWDQGNGWWIEECPDNLSNGAGNLQFVHGSTRRLTINTGGYVDINARLVVRGNGSSYNEGIRILPASNGWSNIWFGSTADLSGNQAGGWLIGRRGAAGAIGAIGDFTIEHNNSNGVGLTLHQAGNATLAGTWFKIANKIALTYVADTESLDFVFS
jgi:hypothetical protein